MTKAFDNDYYDVHEDKSEIKKIQLIDEDEEANQIEQKYGKDQNSTFNPEVLEQDKPVEDKQVNDDGEEVIDTTKKATKT
jgi:hypothetical protein